MLLTVQDIPDIGKGNTLTKKSHNHHHQHHNHLASNQYQYNTDTVKRSHTSSSCTTIGSLQQQQQDDHRRSTTPIQVAASSSSSSVVTNTKPSSTNNINNTHTPTPTSTSTTTPAKELDYYETSSTTTTITPPPSESGRDTPLQQQHQQHYHHNIRDKRDITPTNTNTITTSTSILQQQQRNGCSVNGSQQIINRDTMDLQNSNHHQSFVYPQQSRTDLIYVTSEDEENIPYHAREDSRPFTYGNPTGVQLSPNGSNSNSGTGTGMLKMQSGLSSPSLVRKTLVRGVSPVATTSGRHNSNNNNSASNNSGRKANVRNDFEEMLMQRREKILNEKYSIGDKTPNGSVQYGNNSDKWNNVSLSSTSTNGYHYHEPLKRSNTMDGGFGRSISSDG